MAALGATICNAFKRVGGSVTSVSKPCGEKFTSTQLLFSCSFVQLRASLECRSHRPIIPQHLKPCLSWYATSTPFRHWHRKHHLLNGHLLIVWYSLSLARFLALGTDFLVKLGCVATLRLQDFLIRRHAEDTLLDDSAGIQPGHINVGTVVLGINHVQVHRIHFVLLICLEMINVHLVAVLADDVDVFFSSLTRVGHCLGGCPPFLLVPDALGIQVFARQVRRTRTVEMG